MADLTMEEMKTVQYSRKLKMMLQQTASNLRGLCTVHTGIKDKLFEIPRIGKRKLTLSKDAKGNTPDNDNTFDKRWMAPEFWEDGYVHPTQFALQSQLGDQIFTKTQENMHAACERTVDERMVAALLGAALTGEQGLTPKELPASRKIAVTAQYDPLPEGEIGVATGLTFDKVRLARKKLVKSHALGRGEKAIMLVSVDQLMRMLGDEKATSADFVAVKSLIDGNLNTFMGFEWIQIEALPYDEVRKVRTCVAYVKEALDFGFWEESRSEISKRADKKNCPQIYTRIGLGGVRSDDDGVVAIECHEEPDEA